MKEFSKQRKQQDAASHCTNTFQKDLKRVHGAQSSRRTATYTFVEIQLLIIARQETDHQIFFVDVFPDAVEVGNLVHESWDSACEELNFASILTKVAERKVGIILRKWCRRNCLPYLVLRFVAFGGTDNDQLRCNYNRNVPVDAHNIFVILKMICSVNIISICCQTK